MKKIRFNHILAVLLPISLILNAWFIGGEYHWIFRSILGCCVGASISYLWRFNDLSDWIEDNYLKEEFYDRKITNIRS